MGTVGYMSPEQVRGEEVDHRSDIFSFGVILYEMLTGRRTFTGDSAIEVMNAILKDEPEELPETDMKISPALERIVRRCLEKRPERRFQSASDLGFAIETLSMPSGPRVETAASPRVTGITRPVTSAEARAAGVDCRWIVVDRVAGLCVGVLHSSTRAECAGLHSFSPATREVEFRFVCRVPGWPPAGVYGSDGR